MNAKEVTGSYGLIAKVLLFAVFGKHTSARSLTPIAWTDQRRQQGESALGDGKTGRTRLKDSTIQSWSGPRSQRKTGFS